MLKPETLLLLALVTLPFMAFSQTPPQQPNAADMARKMETTCTGSCHGPSLIAQQRLDRNGWTREVDKMTRWGAPVQPADKDALIAYLARTFNTSRPLPSTSKSVPAGKGSDLFQTYCLACHNDSVVTSRKLSKVGWTAQVDQMIKWGAYVPTARKDELIDYLVAHWGQ